MKRQWTTEIKLTPDQAEVLDLQVADVIRAWQHSVDSTDIRSLARSCYLQGLVDGSKSEVVAALEALKLTEKQLPAAPTPGRKED